MSLLLKIFSGLNSVWLWFFDRFVIYPLMKYVAPKMGVRFMNLGYEPSNHKKEDKKMISFMNNLDLEEYESDRSHVNLYEKALSLHPAYPNFEGLKILEVSCGQGHGLDLIERWHGPTKSLIGCDKVVARTGKNIVYGDAGNLPFGDGSFDFVLNVEASHLYADYQKFFSEVYRVLRPGGIFCWMDIRHSYEMLPIQTAAERARLRIRTWELCNDEVILGLNNTAKKYDKLLQKAPFFVKIFKHSLRATYCAPGTPPYERIREKKKIYLGVMWEKRNGDH